jgi:prepilin-type N-terminal cleavage/methylation domain-containing protein
MNNKGGFTLIEIMASVIILGTGLFLAANAYTLALRASNSARNIVEAVRYAQEEAESLQVSAFRGIPAGYHSQKAVVGPYRDYNYDLTVSEITDTQALQEYLVQACLKLEWQEQGLPKNVGLALFLPKEKE